MLINEVGSGLTRAPLPAAPGVGVADQCVPPQVVSTNEGAQNEAAKVEKEERPRAGGPTCPRGWGGSPGLPCAVCGSGLRSAVALEGTRLREQGGETQITTKTHISGKKTQFRREWHVR